LLQLQKFIPGAFSNTPTLLRLFSSGDESDGRCVRILELRG